MLVHLLKGEISEELRQSLSDIDQAIKEQKVSVLKETKCRKDSSNSSWKRLVVVFSGRARRPAPTESTESVGGFQLLCNKSEGDRRGGPPCPPASVVIKLFSPKTRLRKFYYRNYFLRVFESHEKLLQTSIKTVKPIACGKIGSRLFPEYIFFVMEYLQDAEELFSYYKSSSKTKDEIASELGKSLALMHNQGIFHYDIKPDHLFIKDGAWCFLDLDETSFKKEISHSDRLLNLYQLLRFYLEPLGIYSSTNLIRAYLESSKYDLSSLDALERELIEYSKLRTERSILKHGH